MFHIPMRGAEFGELNMEFDHNKLSKHECLCVAAVGLQFFVATPDTV